MNNSKNVNVENVYFDLLEKISSENSNERKRSLNIFISSILQKNNLGKYICENVDSTFESIREIYMNERMQRDEKNAALYVLCSISFCLLNGFSDCSNILLTDVLPFIRNKCTGFINFAICLIASFSSNLQSISNLLRIFLENFQSNSSKTIQGAHSETLQGIALLLSSFNSSEIFEMFDLISNLIEKCLNSVGQAQVIIAGITIFSIYYECLEQIFFSQKKELILRFTEKFLPMLNEISSKIQKKNDKKTVQSKAGEAIRIIEKIEEKKMDLAFNEQHVSIIGIRKVTIANAIKRVSQNYFLDLIINSPNLQNILGIHFIPVDVISKRHIKSDFQAEKREKQALSKREREKQIQKNRKIKEENYY